MRVVINLIKQLIDQVLQYKMFKNDLSYWKFVMSQPVYEQIFKSLPGIYFILDKDFIVVDASNSYKRLNNVFPKEVIEKNILTLYANNTSTEDLEKLSSSLQEVKNKGNSNEIEIQIKPSSGIQSLKKSLQTIKIIQTSLKLMDQYIIHSVQDVTDYRLVQKIKSQQNKLTEELLTQAGQMEGEIYHYIRKLEEKNNTLIQINEELAKIEAIKSRLATIVESSEDAILAVSMQGSIEVWNDGAKKLYGYSRDEIIGKPVKSLLPENKMEEYFYTWKKLKEGEALHYFDTQRQHKSGRIIPVSITIFPIKNARGEITGACSIARDISEYKTARLLEQKNKELIEISNLKNRFIANVSHEFRTPLHGILGFSKLLKQQSGPLTHKQKEFIDHIINSGNHLNSLINDVLDLTKIEAGKMELTLSQINVSELIEETKNLFQHAISQKNILFTAQHDPTLISIYTDAKKLKQIIYNYLSNAIKFTPVGGVVSLEIQRELDNKFCLTVKDTGIGIHQHHLNQLFVEFQQLDDSSTKEYQGSGLGLAIVRRIATLLGGRVGVTSEPNQGSTFFVILPCHLDQAFEESNRSPIS